MGKKYHALRSVLITALLIGIMQGVTDSAELDLTDQTLKAIQDCMARSPGEWPDEWMQEYLETIRKVVEAHRDTPHYGERLEILRKGFASCWEGLTKKKNESLFEVYCARIRWYTENLMGTAFPSEDERQKLRNQFTDIWDYAARSLLAEFPYLDTNAVQKALYLIGDLYDIRTQAQDEKAFRKVVEQYHKNKNRIDVDWQRRVKESDSRKECFCPFNKVVNQARRRVSQFYTFTYDLFAEFKVLDEFYFKKICGIDTFKFMYYVIEWLELALNPNYNREVFTNLLEKSGRKDIEELREKRPPETWDEVEKMIQTNQSQGE